MNYYAAASIAVLVFATEGGVNVIGLVVPLLALSFAAYKAVANRMEDAARHVREVERLYRATVETLAIAVDAKDQVTHGHIRRVQRHTVAVARALGVSDALELRALEAASLLHDVGKLAVPDYVLNKPGALTHAEFERMKQHAAKGAEILQTVDFPYAVVPIVRHHHEQWNGQGYPDGLAGEHIPFGARVLAVVDCFDAVTSDRPYRRKMSDVQGIDILRAPPRHDVRPAHRRRLHRPDSGAARGRPPDRSAACRRRIGRRRRRLTPMPRRRRSGRGTISRGRRRCRRRPRSPSRCAGWCRARRPASSRRTATAASSSWRARRGRCRRR